MCFRSHKPHWRWKHTQQTCLFSSWQLLLPDCEIRCCHLKCYFFIIADVFRWYKPFYYSWNVEAILPTMSSSQFTHLNFTPLHIHTSSLFHIRIMLTSVLLSHLISAIIYLHREFEICFKSCVFHEVEQFTKWPIRRIHQMSRAVLIKSTW